MERKEIAKALEEIGTLLELKGENPFKIRAYQQAARTVLQIEGDLTELVENGGLAKVKGIGKALSEKITELVTTGRLEYLTKLKESFPPGLFELLKIQGLGSKKIKALYENLGITNLGELEYACLENRLLDLKGFGLKTQANVIKNIETLKKYRGQFLWSEAEAQALELVKTVDACPAVDRVEPAGDFRRLNEVVKNLTLVAVSNAPQEVARFIEDSGAAESIEHEDQTEIGLSLQSGLKARLHLVSKEAFACAWHHFTGSEVYIGLMQQRAETMGLKLNSRGLFDREGRLRPVSDEAEIFALLDLPLIPAELREGRGEIEAAATKNIPDLVSFSDIKGVFHVHSNYSDGGLSITESVGWCLEHGYEYLGLSDHSQTAVYAGGLSLEDLKRQLEEVEEIRSQYPDFRLFWGIESDILPDGSLDYHEDVLAGFDFVIASVHAAFNLSEKEMTDRLIRAVQNPYTTILGHPTGRLLLAREPYAVDLHAVLAAAADTGTIIEINANPHRLDLDWREMQHAKSLGLKMMIGPDAHSLDGLTHIRYGVQAARKGWLAPSDVLNCLSRQDLAGFLENLHRKKKKQYEK
ncbi:MAG: DNA polymerase/3'-5' exonuclease PolX [Deltaproteobacteria bacterium]|nr:DNA polymerase/3'-5' exonuclease PolX [Deltaproteobacteria bacterium]MBW2085281.1 DNA polymerase/3'-5' exonuclease PolX [Deltaproteobacteria bacterium]